VGINTAAAGVKTGSVTVGLTSDGAGSSGLGTSPLTPQTVNFAAQVTNFAKPVYILGSGPASLTGGVGNGVQVSTCKVAYKWRKAAMSGS